MNRISILEDYSPIEARGAAEFKFLGWLFLIQQGAAIILILGLLTTLFPRMHVAGPLDVISQNVPSSIIVIFALLHAGIVVLLLVFRRPFAWTIILSFLGGMAAYSVVELFFGPVSLYNVAGIVVSLLWCAFFLLSKKIRVRFFYGQLFARATQTIVCPHCKKEVLLDAEGCCGTSLTDHERFTALCQRITDLKVPLDVRVAQIELLNERFGEQALSFLNEQYEKQMKSPVRMAKIVAALNRILEP